MQPQVHDLETSDYTFRLQITKGVGKETLKIGGKKTDCVSITVSTPDCPLVQRGYHKLDVANIPVLGYDAECALDKSLVRGEGTIKMIKTILSETIKYYPYVKKFTLIDNSHITCDNGKDISLLSLTLLKYNKTWYEKNFKAYPEDERMREKYATGKLILNDPEIKLPFDKFKSDFLRGVPLDYIKYLEPLYKSTTTYSELFSEIMTTLGPKLMCIICAGWIDGFFTYIYQFNPTTILWTIDAADVEPIEIIRDAIIQKNNSKKQNGGKLRKTQTRKMRKLPVDISDEITWDFYNN